PAGRYTTSEVRYPFLSQTTLRSPAGLPTGTAAGVMTSQRPEALVTTQDAPGSACPLLVVSTTILPLPAPPVAQPASARIATPHSLRIPHLQARTAGASKPAPGRD